MRNFHSILLVGFTFLSSLLGCRKITSTSDPKQGIDGYNNYRVFEGNIGNKNYNINFNELPLEGKLTTLPWSDTYWPSYNGGIQWRWQTDEGNGFLSENFKYKLYSKRQLLEIQNSNPDIINNLSPAEKLSIAASDYDYNLVQYERERIKGKHEKWEGICHGWAPAALNFAEPNPVNYVNNEGINIYFGASDIKALLSYNQGNINDPKENFFVSLRCESDFQKTPEMAITKECRGINPGSLFLILTNHIGINKKGFVLDVTSDNQVWNQPVHSYKSYIIGFHGPSDTAASDTAIEVDMMVKVIYGLEIQPTVESNKRIDGEKWYRFRLELNDNDEIIGGEYISSYEEIKNQDSWPDFAWAKPPAQFKKIRFDINGDSYDLPFNELQKIYEKSLKQTPRDLR